MRCRKNRRRSTCQCDSEPAISSLARAGPGRAGDGATVSEADMPDRVKRRTEGTDRHANLRRQKAQASVFRSAAKSKPEDRRAQHDRPNAVVRPTSHETDFRQWTVRPPES